MGGSTLHARDTVPFGAGPLRSPCGGGRWRPRPARPAPHGRAQLVGAAAMVVKSHLQQRPTATRGRAVICDEVWWVWQGGVGYAHTTTEQPWHGTYMINGYASCMLHDGSITGATHAGGGEGLGNPPGLPLRFS